MLLLLMAELAVPVRENCPAGQGTHGTSGAITYLVDSTASAVWFAGAEPPGHTWRSHCAGDVAPHRLRLVYLPSGHPRQVPFALPVLPDHVPGLHGKHFDAMVVGAGGGEEQPRRRAAGPVQYVVLGWLAKNLDSLPADLQTLLAGSALPLVSLVGSAVGSAAREGGGGSPDNARLGCAASSRS